MEEILCIGCGATIQTVDKTGLDFTPQSALKKVWRLERFIANVVSCLHHYNENHRCSRRMMIS